MTSAAAVVVSRRVTPGIVTARPIALTKPTRIGTVSSNSRRMSSTSPARYGSASSRPVSWKLTPGTISRICRMARNTCARLTSRSWNSSRLAARWSTWLIARRTGTGSFRSSRAKYMPDSR